MSDEHQGPSGDAAAAPRRKRRPRVVAQPQHLPVATELTGSYRQLERPASVDAALANSQAANEPGTAQGPGAGDPLSQLRAKDEDPAGWGEKPDDLAEGMRREKPPHWG